MFMDTYNIGYYINSCAKKTREGMDNGLRGLLDELRRVPEDPPSWPTTIGSIVPQGFSIVVQRLSRFETEHLGGVVARWLSHVIQAPVLFHASLLDGAHAQGCVLCI